MHISTHWQQNVVAVALHSGSSILYYNSGAIYQQQLMVCKITDIKHA